MNPKDKSKLEENLRNFELPKSEAAERAKEKLFGETPVALAGAEIPEAKPYVDLARFNIAKTIEAYCNEVGITPDQLISEHKYWKAEAIKRLEEATKQA